jgi:hypothetical protein
MIDPRAQRPGSGRGSHTKVNSYELALVYRDGRISSHLYTNKRQALFCLDAFRVRRSVVAARLVHVDSGEVLYASSGSVTAPQQLKFR